MQVTISVGGRFHSFYLARELLKRGYLKRLITSYPKFEVAKYNIPKNKVKTVLLTELMDRGWRRAPSLLKNSYNPQFLIHEIFDKWASRLYEDSDIYVGFSSFALHTLKKAKKMGAISVVERGSSHILYQTEILKEEYEQYGLKPKVAHPMIVEKELEEYEEADYISIGSLFVKRTFLDRGVPEKKLIHVPYSVELSQFQQVPKKDNVFRILHCGSLILRKGVHYLLQAFYELDLPDVELWLIGSMSEEIKPFLKKYDNGKVYHKGPYPQRELYKYYSQCSVFALMSIEEGQAIVQSQAMACGLPVIHTPNTGGEDMVREGVDGFMIPLRDTEALKEKIVYLYENQDICRQFGRNARERIRTGFTEDDYGKNMIREYESILKK